MGSLAVRGGSILRSHESILMREGMTQACWILHISATL